MAVKKRGAASASITAKSVGQAQDDAFDDYIEPERLAQLVSAPESKPASAAASPEPSQQHELAAPAPEGALTAVRTPTTAASPTAPPAAVATAVQEPTASHQATPEPAPEATASRTSGDEAAEKVAAVVRPRQPEEDAGQEDDDDADADMVIDPRAYEIPSRLFDKVKDEADTKKWKQKARSPQTEILRLALENAAEQMPDLVRADGQQVIDSPIFGRRIVSAPKRRGATERLQVRMTYGEVKALGKWGNALGVEVVTLVRCALNHRYPEVKRTRKTTPKAADAAGGEAVSDAA